MKTPQTFWNLRAQSYDDQVGPIYEAAYRHTAEKTLKYLNPEDYVLDFACGTGIVTALIAPHVSQIHAIDISSEMVSRATQKMNSLSFSNVQVTHTDLFDPSIPEGAFDAVLAFNVLLYVDNFDDVMLRIRSLLKPDGVFLSATDCLGWNFSKSAILKFWRSRIGKMPYVGFFTQKGLIQKIESSGFTILEHENLFPSPPNLFIAAKK